MTFSSIRLCQRIILLKKKINKHKVPVGGFILWFGKRKRQTKGPTAMLAN